MSGAFALLAGGMSADDLAAAMTLLEVEENADAPGAFSLLLPLSAIDGEPDWIGDARLQPLQSIAVVASGDDGADECIFDGYVLAHSAHLTPGLADSTLRVWGQDASWKLNMEEKAREWSDLTDATVAASIFGEYQIAPAPENMNDDGPLHGQQGHTLMQRGTDAQFLRQLARRSGKLFRVTNAGLPEVRTGVFARPQFGGTPVISLSVTDIAAANVESLDVSWDVMRATKATAGQALLSGTSPATASAEEGLALLDARGLAQFAGEPSTALATAVIDDAGELNLRAEAAVIAAGLFVRVRGQADVARLGAVLRVGTLVSLEALGSVHSGTYYVWSVRHRLTAERHEMAFELVRNAVGPQPAGSGFPGGLGL